MRKLLALSVILASPALAQQPNGTINAPIYATGYISQVGGTNVTTTIKSQPNHPTNLNIYTTGTISGTWTIKLPNPAFEGQMLSFNCGAAVSSISVTSSDGSSLDPAIPTSCGTTSGFLLQFDLRANIWRNIGSGNTAVIPPASLPAFTGDCTTTAGSVAITCPFIQSGVGAVARSVPTKLHEAYVTPQDFNATAGSGGDDAAAIQAAVNAIIANGNGVLYFPKPSAGAYNICSANISVSVVDGSITFLGGGPGGWPVRILPGCASPPNQIFYVNSYDPVTRSRARVTFRDMRIDGYGLSLYGVYDDYSVGLTIDNSVIRNSKAGGANFRQVTGYETHISPSVRLENVNDAGNTIYTNPWDFPAFNLLTSATDGTFDGFAVGAFIANYAALNGGENKFRGHGWGYAAGNDDSQVASQPWYTFLTSGMQHLIHPTGDQPLVSMVRAQVVAGAGQVKVIAQVVSGGTGGTPGYVSFTGTTGTGTKLSGVGLVDSTGALRGPVIITGHGQYTVNPTNLSNEPITGTGVPAGAAISITMGSGSQDTTGPVVIGGIINGPVSASVSGVSFAADVLRPVVVGLDLTAMATAANCIVGDGGLPPTGSFLLGNPGCAMAPSIYLGGATLQYLNLVASAGASYLSCANTSGVGSDPCITSLTANGSGGSITHAVNGSTQEKLTATSKSLAVPQTISSLGASSDEVALTVKNPNTSSYSTTRVRLNANGADRAGLVGQQAGSGVGGTLVFNTANSSGSLVEVGRAWSSGGWYFGSTPVDPGANNLMAEAHLLAKAAPPTISSCGTSPPAASTGSSNNAGQFTLGTGTPTACTVTFASAFPNYAYCSVTAASNYTGTYYISAQSKSAFTVTLGAGTASVVFNYVCGGN